MMIQLFTDFGTYGPYVGQMHAVLAEQTADFKIIDLMHDAPRFNPRAASYLLASLASQMPEQTICVAVVDPGVGTDRRALAIHADGRWFIGPDNGLFTVLPRVFRQIQYYEIIWRPQALSASFHGRDLFVPVAAAIAMHQASDLLIEIDPLPAANPELAEVIYIDGFGNAMTGLPAGSISPSENLIVGDHTFKPARTFGDYATGTAIWYENSNGLIELSITQGNAADALNLRIGDLIIQDL